MYVKVEKIKFCISNTVNDPAVLVALLSAADVLLTPTLCDIITSIFECVCQK